MALAVDTDRAKKLHREAEHRRAKAVTGRRCKWQHCRVDDENHIGNWNSPMDTCPSCYKQLNRKAACPHCSGPQYYDRPAQALWCPNCTPKQAGPGEVVVVLVCLATGQEREIVRTPRWVLPDGRTLRKAHDEGFLVIDVAPKDWAKYKV